jgi:hypothetical protein
MKQLIILFVAVLAMGCGKGKEEAARDADTTRPAEQGTTTTPAGGPAGVGDIIMPLQAGNQWVFQIIALDTTVNALRPFKVDTFSVIRDTFVGNTYWYEIDGLGPDRGFAVNWKDGLWFVRPPDEPFLLAKYPAVLGDEYVSFIGGIKATTKVVALDAKITVPAGTYFCYKYQQSVAPEPMITNYYFAPGVGLVKMEIMDKSGKSPMAENQLMKITLMRLGKPINAP